MRMRSTILAGAAAIALASCAANGTSNTQTLPQVAATVQNGIGIVDALIGDAVALWKNVTGNTTPATTP